MTFHKILDPKQDIRYYQSNMEGGFSGRTIDTQYITPTLKELELPAMTESGWLTRSLEQPYPYTLDYNGKISDKTVKNAFLTIIDFVQKNPDKAEIILIFLLHQVRKITEESRVIITRLSNTEKLDIKTILNCLEEHFDFNYRTHGGSKLPVLAFYSIYQRLVVEVERYKSCTLKQLGSHTASDRTSGSAGDIEIFDKNKNLIEAVEIKYGKEIDMHIIRIAKDKIIKFNPRRYYIFSSADIKESEIEMEVKDIAKEHGCQIITNGIMPTLKYYLRLIMSLEDFVKGYSNLVESDNELKVIHKTKWNEILSRVNLPL